MAEDDLTFAQLCLLITLMGEAREVPHAHLTNVRKIKLGTNYRRDLEERKLITVRKAEKGSGILVDLTEKGWGVAKAQMGRPTPEKGGAAGAALYTMLSSIHGFLDRSDLAPAEFFVPEPGLDVRIRKAYTEIAMSPGELVSLATLRPRLAGADRAGVDAALVALSAAPDVRIVPESNQKTLSAEQRDAAVRIGNQDRHLIAIGV
jgi:hypothetical protein